MVGGARAGQEVELRPGDSVLLCALDGRQRVTLVTLQENPPAAAPPAQLPPAAAQQAQQQALSQGSVMQLDEPLSHRRKRWVGWEWGSNGAVPQGGLDCSVRSVKDASGEGLHKLRCTSVAKVS